jgi:hypothetical protein
MKLIATIILKGVLIVGISDTEEDMHPTMNSSY